VHSHLTHGSLDPRKSVPVNDASIGSAVLQRSPAIPTHRPRNVRRLERCTASCLRCGLITVEWSYDSRRETEADDVSGVVRYSAEQQERRQGDVVDGQPLIAESRVETAELHRSHRQQIRNSVRTARQLQLHTTYSLCSRKGRHQTHGGNSSVNSRHIFTKNTSLPDSPVNLQQSVYYRSYHTSYTSLYYPVNH